MIDATVASSIVIALGSLSVALVTQRQNRKGAQATNVLSTATNALSERVVDREDFDAVMNRMQKALDRADVRIGQLETKLEAEGEARQRAEHRAERAEKRAYALERRVTQLEQVLRDNDITVPPGTPWADEEPVN